MPYVASNDETRSPSHRKAPLTMPAFRNDDEDDNLFDAVNAMADRMGLKGEKRATYIDDHMVQGGYSRVQSRESYAIQRDPEGDEGGDSNRWGFGGGRGRPRNNQGGGNRDNDDTF